MLRDLWTERRLTYDAQFLIEVWVLYGIGMLVFIARFAVRLKTVGFRGFQGDDLFAVLLILFYTGDAVLVDIVCKF